MPEIKLNSIKIDKKPSRTPEYKLEVTREPADYMIGKPLDQKSQREYEFLAGNKEMKRDAYREAEFAAGTKDPKSQIYKETALLQSSKNLDPKNQFPATTSMKNDNSWTCSKCSASISNTLYECTSCRFINWDKFYTLKSKSPKVRSESIPAKASEREELSRKYMENKAEPRNNTKDSWRNMGSEIKVQENYVLDDYGRKGSREFFNR